MRKIFLAIALIVSFTASSQFVNFISRNSASDTSYGTHYDTLQKGGYQVVTNKIVRNAIPYALRKKGMWVKTAVDDSVFNWDGSQWAAVVFSSGSSSVDYSSLKIFSNTDATIQPVTNRLQMPNQNFFEGAPTVVTYRTRFALMSSVGWVRVIYDNNTYNQLGINPYTIKASLQAVPTESTNINSVALVQLTFNNGDTNAVVYPGKQVISDPVYIGLDAVNGAYLMMRNCVTAVGAVANKWPVGLTNRYAFEGAAIGDLTESGDVFDYDANGQQSFAPFMIGSIRVKQNSYGLMGNSIADGSNDLVPTRGFGGFLQDKYQVPLSKAAVGGETLTFFNSGNYYGARYVYIEHGNYVMSEYGTNDIGIGRSSIQLEQDFLKFFHDTHRTGKKHIELTILPRASSTDNWQTASNQTPWEFDTVRIAVNNWLRAGGPCYLSADGYTATPAPIGSGVACPWLYKTIDMASAVEVNSSNVLTVNGGRWLVGDTLTSGTATGGATYMLQDTNKDFNNIKVSGALLVVTGGTGGGQVVTIVGAASSTQINFKTSLSIGLDNTSVYHILDAPTYDQVHPNNNFHERIADYIYSQLPADNAVSNNDTAYNLIGATGDAAGIVQNRNLPLTLKNVNSNIGTFGSSTMIPSVTVNAKGLVTAVTQNAISVDTTIEDYSGVTDYAASVEFQQAASITLPAGNWDISFTGSLFVNGATLSLLNTQFALSTTPNSDAGTVIGKSLLFIAQAGLGLNSFQSVSSAALKVTPTSTTTYYLNALSVYSLGTPQFSGYLRARRIR